MDKNLRKELRLLEPLKTHFMVVAGFSAFYNLLFLAPSIYMMQVYDRVLTTGGINTLLFLSLILVVSLAVLALLDRLRSAILIRAGLRMDRDWARPVIAAMLSPKAPAEARSALRDFDQLRQTITSNAVTALCDAPWTPIFILVCFLIHPVIGMVSIGGVILLLGLALLNQRATTRVMMEAAGEQRAHYSTQDGSIGAGDAILTLGMTAPLADLRADERIGFISNQARAALVGGGFSSATRFVRLLLQSSAIGIGGYLAVKGLMSPGGIIASSIILSRALMPVEQLVQAWRPLTTARESLRNVNMALKAVDEADRERMPLPAPQGSVKGEKITYSLEERPVLKALDFEFMPGELVGVLGPSGAGKSTLSRILVGAVTPTDGVMRLDNTSYDDWGHERLARHVGYLPQSPSLLAGTVADNISRFQTKIAENDQEDVSRAVIEAAELAGVHDMIRKDLPNGYDTMLGPGGVGVSAGQAQRIGLARALFGNPALLVLDEPNAHMDAEGEARLVAAMKALCARGCCVVVVAHRTSVLNSCQKLMVIANGKIDLFGKRDDVVAQLAERRKAVRAVAEVAQ